MIDLRELIDKADQSLSEKCFSTSTKYTYKTTYNRLINYSEGFIRFSNTESIKSFFHSYIDTIDGSNRNQNTYNSRITAIKYLVKIAHDCNLVKQDFSDEFCSKGRWLLSEKDIMMMYKTISHDVYDSIIYYNADKCPQNLKRIYPSLRNAIIFHCMSHGVTCDDLIKVRWRDISDFRNGIPMSTMKECNQIEQFLRFMDWYQYVIIGLFSNTNYSWIINSDYIFPSRKGLGATNITIRTVELEIKSLVQRVGMETKITPKRLANNLAGSKYGYKVLEKMIHEIKV